LIIKYPLCLSSDHTMSVRSCAELMYTQRDTSQTGASVLAWQVLHQNTPKAELTNKMKNH